MVAQYVHDMKIGEKNYSEYVIIIIKSHSIIVNEDYTVTAELHDFQI
jgi:hypothetical protein